MYLVNAHRKTDNEDEVEFEERMDTGGGPQVPEELHDAHNDYLLAPEKKA